MACRTGADRQRVLDNREVYLRFIDVVADALAWAAEKERAAAHNRRRLDALLTVTDPAALMGGIVGASPTMRGLRERVGIIADSPANALITGETGTGKELFARAIHAASRRKNNPFVAVNCGAIPEALLESELFGYERGAFTGASPEGRLGKFELAEGGTLFLDEIGVLPLRLQAKLLRALQDHTFSRLGSSLELKADVRIIAATNARLPELVGRRMFREDLYYRLNVIPLELPPLRERKEDIPALAEFFLDRHSRRLGRPRLRLAASLLKRLQAHEWPGNVRELENCLECLIALHKKGDLDETGLPPGFLQTPDRLEEKADAALTPILPLAEVERRAIRNALRHFEDSRQGKIQAAEALKIGIATLYRKLRQN
jgi:transcriptional regulator with PAS, ATPase and Fis domain